MNELEAEDRKHSRTHWFFFGFFSIIGVCTLAGMLLGFGKGDLLVEIVKSIALFAGGFGGGFGLSYLTRR